MVPTTPSRIGHTGDGVATSFAFPYYFQAQADLKVFTFVLSTGVFVPLVLNVDYTIVGVFTPGFGYESGAAILIPGSTTNVPAVIPNTEKVVIFRDPAELQNLNLPVSSVYPPVPIESEFDALVLMMQRLYDVVVNRAAKLPDGFGDVFDPTLPADIVLKPNMALMSDPTGRFFVMGVPAGSGGGVNASITTTGVDVSGGNVPNVLPQASLNPNTIVVLINKSFGSPNHIAVSTTGGDTIMGAATDTVEAGEAKWYWSDGISEWFVIN